MITRCLLLLAFCFTIARAATYYVRTDGNNGNTGLVNSSGGAWLTIDYAADHVTAGDTVRIQVGTYAERVTPSQTGTSANAITFIADGVVNLCSMELSTDYLRFIGLTIDNDGGGCVSYDGCVRVSSVCDGLEFWHCTFKGAEDNAIQVTYEYQINNSIIIGNLVSDMGVDQAGGAVGLSLHGTNNIVAYNSLTNIYCDGMVMPGNTNAWMNNFITGLKEDRGGHPDVFQVGSAYNMLGWEYNTFEANMLMGMGVGGNEHAAQISYGQGALPSGNMRESVWRRNIWHNIGSGGIGINQTFDGSVTETWIYHDTGVDFQRITTGAYGGHVFLHAGTSNIFGYNNIAWEMWSSDRTSSLNPLLAQSAWMNLNQEHNLAYDPNQSVTFLTSWNNQTNEQSDIDPGFVDKDTDDFRITALGGAYQRGGALTLVNEPSDTTGTSFDVDDASPFRPELSTYAYARYGGNLWVGDTITIGTDTRTIVSISGNTITVDSALTWVNDDPVYFGSSTTPDLGALPYSHVPLSAATYTTSGNDYTVTPSGDTRFVTFFEDGIPVTVDNASPYTYTSSGGTVICRAYPLYASQTLWVEATDAGAVYRVGRSGTVRAGTVRRP